MKKETLSKLLDKKNDLLREFSRYLPHEIGQIVWEVYEKLRDYQEEFVKSPELKEVLREKISNFDQLTNKQRGAVLIYVALLSEIEKYEKALKELEKEGYERLSQLKDERFLQEIESLKKTYRRGRKPTKRMKLEKLKGKILTMRRQGLGTVMISRYLEKRHRLKVSPRYLKMILEEWGEG